MKCIILRRSDRMVHDGNEITLTVIVGAKDYHEGAKLVLGCADIVQGSRDEE